MASSVSFNKGLEDVVARDFSPVLLQFLLVCNFPNIKTLITIVILALDTDAFMDVFDKAGDIDNVIGSGRYDAKVIILVILVIWRTLACFDCHLKVVDTH